MFDSPWPMNSWLPSMRWPRLTRDRARDRHRLGEPEHRQRQRGRHELAPDVGTKDGQRQRRQPRRQRADRRHAARARRARARRRTALPTTMATIMYGTRGSSRCDEHADDQCGDADRGDPRVDASARLRDERVQRSRRNWRRPGSATPKKLLSCAAMISSAGAGGEADDHRVRNEVDQRAQARQRPSRAASARPAGSA